MTAAEECVHNELLPFLGPYTQEAAQADRAALARCVHCGGRVDGGA